MNYYRARNFLNRYKITINHCIRLKEQLDNYDAEATATGGFDYSKPRVISSPDQDAQYIRFVMNKERKERLYKDMRTLAVKQKLEILNVIQQIDSKYQEMMISLYINMIDWHDLWPHGEVAESTYYRWHAEALKKVEEVLDGKMQRNNN